MSIFFLNLYLQTLISIELYCTARSEKYFKDPLEFRPERWLRENKDEIHAFSNLSFGFGTRMCLGKRKTPSTDLSEATCV